MSAPLNFVPNDRNLVRAFAGTESPRFTKTVPKYKLYGDMKVVKTRTLGESNDHAGTRFGDYTPNYGPWQINGTYAQQHTFEDHVILPRYGVSKARPPVADANMVKGYTYEYMPDSLRPGMESMSVEYNVPGVPFSAEGVIWNEFTINGDTDDADGVWKFSSNLLGRAKDEIVGLAQTAATGGSTSTVVNTGAAWTANQWQGAYTFIRSGANAGSAIEIASNTADTLTLTDTLPAVVASGDLFEISGLFTPGITDRDREKIPFPGTKLFLDDGGGTIGSSQVQGKFISFSTTFANNMYFKRFGENKDDYAKKTNAGKVKVTGQIRFEFDDPVEYRHALNGDVRLIRIQQTGSEIDPTAHTHKTATIDVYAAYYNAPDDGQARQDNLTLVAGFVGFVDKTEAVPISLSGIVPMATLPD